MPHPLTAEPPAQKLICAPIVEGLNYRLDFTCFQSDGTDDTDDGGMTGIFADGTVPTVDAAAENTSIERLVRLDFIRVVAQGYLHSGNPTAQRARRIAVSQSRDRVTLADMEKALETWGKPALKSMDAALKRADATAARCKAKVRNWRPDTEAQTTAKGKRRNQIVTSSDLEQSSQGRPARALQDSGSNAADEQFHHRGESPRVGTRPGRGVIPADLEMV